MMRLHRQRRSRPYRNNREGSLPLPPVPSVIVVIHKEKAPKKERHWQLVEESENCSDCDDYFGPTKKTVDTEKTQERANKNDNPVKRYPLEAISRLESIHNIDLDEFCKEGSDDDEIGSLMEDPCDADEFAYNDDLHEVTETSAYLPEVTETTAYGEMEQLYDVEVTPGVFKTLRGADYTQECLKKGQSVETMCFVCDIRLACAEGCEGVVCPQCFSISPVGTSTTSAAGYIGIGLHLKK
eukprot:scaffold25842_cov198-Amphora_coffeaeformis.AAC.30